MDQPRIFEASQVSFQIFEAITKYENNVRQLSERARKDCYLYKPVEAEKGLCIDIEVSADMNTEDCKRNAYRPKYLGI